MIWESITEIYIQCQNTILWGNSCADYIHAMLLFLGLFLGFRLFRTVIILRIKALCGHNKYYWDEKLIIAIENISPNFWRLLSVFIAVQTLNMPIHFNYVFIPVIVIWGVIEGTRIVQLIAELFLLDAENHGNRTAVQGTKMMLKFLLWSLALVLILSNIGIDVSALATSLGILGIAVALAIQNILSDLFASFTIYFDKPFKVGDWIQLGDNGGSVEKIGLKTTRLRSLDGEELVISNRELTETRINNYGELKERRISFDLRIDYYTDNKKLQKVSEIVQKAVELEKDARFDFGALRSFEDYYMRYQFVYFLSSDDWYDYVNTQEDVLIQIKEALEKNGIKIAYPVQKVIWDGEENPYSKKSK